jgi:hypothetical protein
MCAPPAIHSHSLVVGGLKDSGLLEGLALLLLDAALALLGSAVSLSVGHAEHVISLDAAAHTGVAGNGLAELEALLLVLNTVEDGGGLVEVLAGLLASGNGVAGSEGVLNVGNFDSKEGGDGLWGHGLLQNVR